MVPFLLVMRNVAVTARHNADLVVRSGCGWYTLVDRSDYKHLNTGSSVAFPDTYGDLSG